jgi:hypothetical protein
VLTNLQLDYRRATSAERDGGAASKPRPLLTALRPSSAYGRPGLPGCCRDGHAAVTNSVKESRLVCRKGVSEDVRL